MKLVSIKELPLPGVKIISFGRFCDERGYFTEPFRLSDFNNNRELAEICKNQFVQVNESLSHAGVIRGLHFQWNPYMGKLVRTLSGRMVDIVLDIRLGSPTQGKALLYELADNPLAEYSEWIWIPPGFAHGNFFTEPSKIEYFCTGEYSPGCEAGIYPWSCEIDWSLADSILLKEFFTLKDKNPLISAKDKAGLSLPAWFSDQRATNFIFGKL